MIPSFFYSLCLQRIAIICNFANKKHMNFALSLNDKYVMPCLALSTSIFENNRKNDCRIYLLTDGLKEENISKFDRLASIYKQQIIIKKVPKELYDNLPFIKRYTFATYNRFMIADLIEDSKVIYLDGDIIVRHDLSDLWNTPIDGYASGVVEDQRGDDIFIHNLNKVATPYFNAGVQLINLDYWRENNIGQKMAEYMKEHPDNCPYADQDPANKILSGKVKYLDFKYNFMEDWFYPTDQWQIHFSKWDRILADREDPYIVHYCRGLKPWFKECVHPLKHEFIHYATMHDFIGYKEQKYFPFSYKVVSYLIYRLRQIQDSYGK